MPCLKKWGTLFYTHTDIDSFQNRQLRIGHCLLNQLKYSNTPEAHDYHHLKSKSNYGLYFTFWDKIMGTYHVESHLNT